MTEPPPDRTGETTRGQRYRALAVHLYTATGIGFAFWAAAEIAAASPDLRLVFGLFALTVLIDATDGPLARRYHVKRWAPHIDGRTIDDIIDYITYTFLPLLLVWRMGWLPEPAFLWIVPALIASLFGFANTAAKDERGGFFLGFPSYWNVVAFYLGIGYASFGPWPNAAVVLGLALLTVLPVRFVYPNLAPRPWDVVLAAGGLAWLGLVAVMLLDYPDPPGWMAWVSLLYPALYLWASVRLSRDTVPQTVVYPPSTR